MGKEFDFSDLETLNYHIHPYLEPDLIKNGKYIFALRDLYKHLVKGGIYKETYGSDEHCKDEIEYYKKYGDLQLKNSKNYIDCLVIFEMFAFNIIDIISDASIKKHEEVLIRKRKQLITSDDYGFENNELWMKEAAYFAHKVIAPTISNKFNNHPNEVLGTIFKYIQNSNNFDLSNYIPKHIDSNIELFAHLKKRNHKPFNQNMSGQNYEHYVAELFTNSGYNARVTKISGDHGADIIATKENIKIVVQCKFYSSPVGNSSVQEIYSAKDYYDGDIACVVTNNNYTQAAKSAAGKLGVHLLHHDQIEDFLKEI